MRRAREAARHARDRTFRSLREPNYRRYFTGQAVSVVGTWMQRVAQDWLVLTLTGSGVALGISTALQFGPLLVLGLWAGAVVDRLNRRLLIIWTQTIQAVLAATLAVLTLTGTVELWMVYALALALGIVTAFDTPARQAFVGEMVEPENYVNAQALSSTIHNAGRLVGPAIAGLLIATTDVGVAFAVNAVSFVGVLIGLLRIDPSGLRPVAVPESGKGAARAGLRYVLGTPELRATLLLIGVIALFGQNFRVVLPITATEVLGGNAATYGYLTAALGLGAVMGALGAASRQTVTGRGLLLWTVAFGVVNLATALVGGLMVALAALVAVGVTNILFNTLARTLLQLHSDPVVQGRVMALHGLLFLGTTPIGGPLLGWVCAAWGSEWAWVVAGATALAVAGVCARPMWRAGDPTAQAVPVASSSA